MNKIQTALEQEIVRLQQRLERERKARIEAESIAEQGLRALYIKQKETTLMQQIAVAANEAPTVAKAFQTVLDIICDYTSWAVGHVYTASDLTGGQLCPTDLWYIASASYNAFRKATEEMSLSVGIGLPGRVVDTGKPQWIPDIACDPGFLRGPVATQAGLKSAFAFPVKKGDRTVAVFEFFSEEIIEPNQRQLEIMNFTDLQLGRVIERSAAENELKSYTAKLQQTNRELQEIANIAAHDLQEPLRKIQAFSDIIKIKVAGTLPDEGRDYIDRMQNAARRMQLLINDMLAFSRVTLKAQPFVPVDLAVIAREVVADMDIRIQQAGGSIAVGDLPTIEADPLQIRQLFTHLLSNSLKFNRRGTPLQVQMSYTLIECGEQPHTTTRDKVHKCCRLVIEDNGIGFDDKYSDRIFGIFQRVHPNEQYEGTGMGLAICRKIVERHNGTIVASSEPGKGSSFIITLPVRHFEEHPFHV